MGVRFLETSIVNAPLRSDATPRLEDFPYRLSDNVRFADLDPNQHVNNASYASYFETGRVTLVKDRSHGLMPEGFGWVMVRLDMHFRAELHWPQDRSRARPRQIRPYLGDLRSGGVFGRQMCGVGTGDDGADR
jgi:Thioesterase-like superfamily